MDTLQIKCLHGKEIAPYLIDLAKLRMTIFRDYPYLYEGNLDYEKKYLATYLNCPDSLFVLVFDGKQLVGASTAIPLKNEVVEFKAPFLAAGLDVNTILYFGESVLLPAYRGQKIYPLFFNEREKYARKLHYKMAAFSAVLREENHPLRPHDWTSLEPYWQRMGYEKHPELKTSFSWKDVGYDNETLKPMLFWLKPL